MPKSINWEAWNGVEGWMAPEAASLMKMIAAEGVGRGVLEFGVFKGKLLSLAAALFEGPVVGVDAMWNGVNNPLTGADLENAKNLVLSNVGSVSGGVVPEIVVSDTTLLSAQDLLRYSPSGFGFISVDASHDADPVCHDLHLAASVLSPGGVIMLDDGFNAACPGVAEGMFQFLHSDSRLKAFATGYNKTLFTDANSYAVWLNRIYQAVKVGEEAIFERTRQRLEVNAASRWKPYLVGSELVPFV